MAPVIDTSLGSHNHLSVPLSTNLLFCYSNNFFIDVVYFYTLKYPIFFILTRFRAVARAGLTTLLELRNSVDSPDFLFGRTAEGMPVYDGGHISSGTEAETLCKRCAALHRCRGTEATTLCHQCSRCVNFSFRLFHLLSPRVRHTVLYTYSVL